MSAVSMGIETPRGWVAVGPPLEPHDRPGSWTVKYHTTGEVDTFMFGWFRGTAGVWLMHGGSHFATDIERMTLNCEAELLQNLVQGEYRGTCNVRDCEVPIKIWLHA